MPSSNEPIGSDGQQYQIETEVSSVEEKVEPPPPPRRGNQKQTITIILLLLLWTYLYNLFIKEQGFGQAFFKVLDTVSDDFVMGSTLTIGVGLLIVLIFSITKLYSQIVANIYSFKILEDMWYNDLGQGKVRDFFAKLLNFSEQPQPETVCPRHPASILFSFSFIYLMSCIYVILFSEALFFVSWSAGVDLPINEHNLIFMPTLALAIPFSARVMAYLRYPYAQDYADFMPGAAFVFLIVASLGYLFESQDQKFFLLTVYRDRQFWSAFLSNGVFLAFIPVFFESMFWLFELHRSARKNDS